jgi:hypothetical protein
MTTIQLYGINNSSCGYCKSNGETSVSYGIVSFKMLILDYEKLMLQGLHLYIHFIYYNFIVKLLFFIIMNRLAKIRNLFL